MASTLHDSKSLQSSLINHFDYKLEHLLKWEDLNSMAFSIESRVPFLDFRLVERTLASANKLKINNGYTKSVLRKGFKSILPDEITYRKDKIGFLNPRNEWLKTEKIVELFKGVFNESSLTRNGIINKKEFQSLYETFLKGQKDYSKEIWKVFVLEKWLQKYF
ncbi:MAG: asparagine synthase-related protein [Bacteroidales bacterium]